MKSAVVVDLNSNVIGVETAVLKELKTNNTAFPDIKRVIYNIGKKAYPKLDANGKHLRDENGKFIMSEPVDVLATIVYFADDTKISVVNSASDGAKFENVTVADGTTVKTATRESKEIGLVYAIVKRLCAKFDPATGKMTESGISRILNDIIKNSFDSPVEAVKLKLAKAKSKEEHLAKLNSAKPKENYSIKGTLERINKLLDKVDNAKKSTTLDKIFSKLDNILN